MKMNSPNIPRFVYLEYGSQSSILSELHYSLATLQAEGIEGKNISIATDMPERYLATPYDIIDISKRISTYRGKINYSHRIKPSLILDILKSYQTNLVLLDTDTYFRSGFLMEIKNAMADGVGMNFFIRRDPYRGFGPFTTKLPSGITYTYDPQWSLMYNSGVVAVKPEHISIIEDSITLIDQLWAAGLQALDVDQFAATETFRIHGQKINPVFKNIHHYHSRWTRRYIHWKFNQKSKIEFNVPQIRRPDIFVNKTAVRVFKAYSIFRSWINSNDT